jgi:glutaredoxin-related protein
MKDYYKELKQFYEMKKSTELLAKLEKLKAANNEVEIIKLYNDAKKLGLKESKDKFTKSKLKQYIKEVIIETLSESTIDVSNPNTLSPSDEQNLINTARIKTKNPKLGTSSDPVNFVESELTELEPNSKQKLKLANKELAFLAKKVRSLEKQLKSPGSDENEG